MFARRNGLSPAPRRRHAPCSLCGRARVPLGRSALPSPMRHASTSRAASVLPPSRRVHSRVVERPSAWLVRCRAASVLSPTRLVHPRAAVHLTALAGVLTRLRTPGARSPSLAAGLARVFRLRCPRPPRRLPTNPRPRAVRDFYPHLWITFSRPITGSHPPPEMIGASRPRFSAGLPRTRAVPAPRSVPWAAGAARWVPGTRVPRVPPVMAGLTAGAGLVLRDARTRRGVLLGPDSVPVAAYAFVSRPQPFEARPSAGGTSPWAAVCLRGPVPTVPGSAVSRRHVLTWGVVSPGSPRACRAQL
ncbi:hypothetical protein FB570_113204 [Streptomyces sp. T12]|nr:hypothetical protein FB570_113204 [Streptomyces sp. T12]